MVSLIRYFTDIKRNLNKIFQISKFDYIKSYRDNNLGIVWMFLNPTIQILTYYLVFGTGLKGSRNVDYPFFLWLISGIIPWFFIGGSISSGVKAITSKMSTIAKMKIRFTIFPIISLLTQLYTHIIMIVILFIFAYGYGYTPSYLVFYYLLAAFLFLLGFTTVLATYTTIIKDFANLVSPVMRLMFWFLPIVWNTDNLSEQVQLILQLNPMFYIVNGYRHSIMDVSNTILIPYYHLYFWIITLLFLIIGARGIYRHYYDFYESV